MKKALILGPGFVGGRMAVKWQERGVQVFTFTRSQHKSQSLSKFGVEVLAPDFCDLPRINGLPKFDYALVSLSWDRGAGSSHRQVFGSAFEAISEAIQSGQGEKNPFENTRFFLTSTTGVYARTAGNGESWVDENGLIEPRREGASLSYELEQNLSKLLAGRLTILRLAGIYHRDRIPGLKQIQSGQPLSGDPDAWMNLIHADDICAVVDQLSMKGSDGGVFNVSDGKPVRRLDYYKLIAQKFGLSPIGFEEKEAARGSGLRIDTGRLTGWLGREFSFFDLEKGIQQGSSSPV